MKGYDKAIVVGRGKTPSSCAEMLAREGLDTEFFVVNNGLQKISQSVRAATAGQAAVSSRIIEKQALEELLLAEQGRTLLVSAANPWLIPEKILRKENLTAINFHSALLPRHPGRNAESWAIFEQDENSGITWHFVNAQVDAGEIIIQKAVPITDSMTALQLLHAQNNAAIEAFGEILPSLLAGTCSGVPQKGPRGKLHYSWERPNDGVLDLNWSGARISAFLRATDYGVLKLMGEPVLCWNGKKYSWKKYTIESDIRERDGIDMRQNELIIIKDHMLIRLHEMDPIVKSAGGGYNSLDTSAAAYARSCEDRERRTQQYYFYNCIFFLSSPPQVCVNEEGC